VNDQKVLRGITWLATAAIVVPFVALLAWISDYGIVWWALTSVLSMAPATVEWVRRGRKGAA
jgi:hypothetical protein